MKQNCIRVRACVRVSVREPENQLFRVRFPFVFGLRCVYVYIHTRKIKIIFRNLSLIDIISMVTIETATSNIAHTMDQRQSVIRNSGMIRYVSLLILTLQLALMIARCVSIITRFSVLNIWNLSSSQRFLYIQRQLISPTGTHRHQMVHQFLQSDSGEYFPYQKLGSLNLIKVFAFHSPSNVIKPIGTLVPGSLEGIILFYIIFFIGDHLCE